MSEYFVVKDFEAGKKRVLELNREFDYIKDGKTNCAIIDGHRYNFVLNSIPTWIIIDGSGPVKGKKVVFE